jgi:hypothetical protein
MRGMHGALGHRHMPHTVTSTATNPARFERPDGERKTPLCEERGVQDLLFPTVSASTQIF